MSYKSKHHPLAITRHPATHGHAYVVRLSPSGRQSCAICIASREAQPGRKAKKAASRAAWINLPENRLKLVNNKAASYYRPGERERVREYQLQRSYGISGADYECLLAFVPGCAICGRTPEENGRRLAVDHDHATGRVRGLLCADCNSGIGLLKEGALFPAALAYLSHIPHNDVTTESIAA